MKIDLQKDQKKIRRYIEKRIRDYPVYENLGPGNDEDPIAMMTVGYYVEQGGYVAVVFDTRADANHDGQWTLHLENDENILYFSKWEEAMEKLYEGKPFSLILPDGSHKTIDDDDDSESLASPFGEMLVEVMCSLRDEGAFADLPLTSEAYFVIEEFDGHFGWPEYETRKKLGRLVP